jgi:C4-dicarboxylate-specific signal transduction histidine kinase
VLLESATSLLVRGLRVLSENQGKRLRSRRTYTEQRIRKILERENRYELEKHESISHKRKEEKIEENKMIVYCSASHVSFSHESSKLSICASVLRLVIW